MTESDDGRDRGARAPSRRTVLRGAAVAAAGVLFARPAVAAAAPAGFPGGIGYALTTFENWAGTVHVTDVPTATPTTADDIVRLVEWAHATGRRVRARGAMHSWSPLSLVPGEANPDGTLLVDTRARLTGVSVDPAAGTVTCGAGANLLDILDALEAHGLGWANSPAIGDITIGGALAIGAHGATHPAAGEEAVPGQSFGSLSNLVLRLTAVVWDGGRYALRTFDRQDPEIGALLAHLGRSFVTEVTLQAGANVRLRCRSSMDIGWQELFAPAASGGRTFESMVAEYGRVEAIWFPFTSNPWLKIWSVEPTRPAGSREVTGPYNYPFSDLLPEPVTDLMGQVGRGAGHLTPAFGQSQLAAVTAGLVATGATDLWGWSKNTLFYLRATTMRVIAGGGVVITARENIGRVIDDFTRWLHGRMDYYAQRGEYPVNGPFEVRLCGVDDPSEVVGGAAGIPWLSAVRPVDDRPEWTTAIWMNVVSMPGTPGVERFFRELDDWMASHYTGDYAQVRSEWAKGWAFTDDAAYANDAFVEGPLRAGYRRGIAVGDWDEARATLDRLDPHRVFSNPLLDKVI